MKRPRGASRQARVLGIARTDVPPHVYDMAADATDDWSVPIEHVFDSHRSSPAGLSAAEAAARLAQFGPNVPAPRHESGPLALLAAQFTSPITTLLFVAAVLSIVLGERLDGMIILAILLVSAGLGFWQEHHAATAVAHLLALVRTTATVVRGGQDLVIPIEQVVSGDVVRLAAGANVPGDARLIESKDLFVDQAALTGESYPAEKLVGTAAVNSGLAERTNAVYAGTHVVSGTALALVVRTGADTEFGAIAQQLALKQPETEFEHGVRRFGALLMEITAVLAIVILCLNVALHRPVLETLLFTLALAVGLTPQLLPAIVSVTLAQGARQMAAKRVIVRRLAAIEDLGGMQILCTDKTGTLTEGVVALHEISDYRGAVCERARVYAYANAALETGFPNPIDDALRAAPPPNAPAYEKLDEVPYDFIRKRLSIVVRDGSKRVLITKGALSAILDVCTRAEDAAGAVVPISDARGAVQAQYEALSRDAFRCLGVAYRELDRDGPVSRDDERDLTFLGTVSLADPLKPNAKETLAKLSALGIQLTLITGDNEHVAARLAADAGLDATHICTGKQLRDMSDGALLALAPKVGVFAEVEPNQKERIILALKKRGLAVGYMGDGINDASALHAADVGISVESATDVTKQAADIVLLDKDLGVLEAGVREGRRAFANTLKYVFITTSASFGNMISMAGASLMVSFLPLLPKQILLINVLTDLPAMAVSTDDLDPEMVARPRRWDNRAIRRFMLSFGLVSSVFDYVTFGALYLLHVAPPVFRTGWFLESILSEILILLVIRTRRPFFKSHVGRGLLWTSVAVGAATFVIPYTPLSGPLELAPLSGALLGIIAAIVLAYVATSELTKRIVFRTIAM